MSLCPHISKCNRSGCTGDCEKPATPPPFWWSLALIAAAVAILLFWHWLPWIAEAVSR